MPLQKVWTAPVEEVEASLSGPTVSAEWIAGMCSQIKANWFTPEMSEPEEHAWIEGFWDDLKGLPLPVVDAAWRTCRGKLTRRPSPADLKIEAERIRKDAREAVRLRRASYEHRGAIASYEQRVAEDQAPPKDIPEEERERCLQMVKGLARKMRVRRQKRAQQQPTYRPPKRRSDAEVQAIIRANPARAGMSVQRFRELEGDYQPTFEEGEA